jgi:hypothetical protein
MESFFHSLKSDVIHGEQFHSEAQLRYDPALHPVLQSHPRALRAGASFTN